GAGAKGRTRLARVRVRGAVVLAPDGEDGGGRRGAAVGVLRTEGVEAEARASGGDHLTIRAPQLVARIVRHLLRRVGEEGLLRVVFGVRLVALEKVFVAHGATLRRQRLQVQVAQLADGIDRQIRGRILRNLVGI